MIAARRLAAILAAGVVGYSRLIGADERGTLRAFKTIQAVLFDPVIAAHNGRLAKTTGDGFLVELPSPSSSQMRIRAWLGYNNKSARLQRGVFGRPPFGSWQPQLHIRAFAERADNLHCSP
jgi:class 3 adenylate cyclase